MNVRLIQEQVSLESQVKFAVQGGRDISGKLIEIGLEHIKIEVEENQLPVVIPIEQVSYFQPLKDISQDGKNDGDMEMRLDAPKSELVEHASEHVDESSTNGSTTEEKPEVDSSKNSKTDGLADSEIEIEKRLVEIETRFQAKCQSAKLEIREPDFILPEAELGDKQKKGAAKTWDRIQNKYQHAKKINELSTKFGRIQPIISELKNLAKSLPNSISIKRHLAYLYMLSGNRQEALNFYRDTAIHSQQGDDWYNLAAVAQETANEELVCYGLGQVFQKSPLIDELNAWYMYVHLLIEFDGYRELDLLCQTETNILLETTVYILRAAKQETISREILNRSIGGDISIPFLQQTLNALDEQPTENYRKITEEISNMTKASYYIKENQSLHNHDPDQESDRLIKRVNRWKRNLDFRKNKNSNRTIRNWYELAENAADIGEYGEAISHIKQVLLIDKNYLKAQENYEKWREYERIRGVPKGSNPFAFAKRAQLIEKDLDRAENFFRQAISQNDNLEAAVNDLAALLSQLDRCDDAIQIIEQNRSRIHNWESLKKLENVLLSTYMKANKYGEAIKILKKQLKYAVISNNKKDNAIRTFGLDRRGISHTLKALRQS